MSSRVAWSVRLGMVLIRLLGATWRIKVVGDDRWKALRAAGTPILLSLWHGDLLPLTWAHRNMGIVVLVSEHRDGEIIAQVLERLGYRTTRGSSTRGGSRGLLGLIRALAQNEVGGVTPDGPRGPRHSIQPGVLAAARKAGARVVAMGVATRGAWTLRTWDAFAIPKPFARVYVAYSDPLEIGADVTDIAAEVPRLAASMAQAHERAHALARA